MKGGLSQFLFLRRENLMKKKLIIFLFTILSLFLLSTLATAYQITLSCEADAYVDSQSPDINYNGNALGVGAGPIREVWSYLRFDLGSLSTDLVIESATLRLYVNDQRGSPGDIESWFVDNDSWQETTLRWNNCPAQTSLIGTNIGSINVNDWVEWDVLSSAQNTYVGDKKLSMRLNLASGIGGDRFVSSEVTINPPELQLEVRAIPEPATVLLLIGGLIGMKLGRKKLF